MHAEVGAEHLAELPAQVVERGLGGAELRLGDHDPHGAVAERVQPVHAALVDLPGRGGLAGHLDLGDEGAARGIRPDEVDARRPAHGAAPAVRADDVPGAYRVAGGEENVDGVVVLRDADDFGAAADGHAELVGPLEEQRLDPVLEEGERVRVPGGQAVEVDARAAERDGVEQLAFGEEAVGDAALVEQLDGARVHAAATPAGELRGRAPLEDQHVRAGEPQLGGQHQSRRPGADDHHVRHVDLASLAPT